MLKLKYLFENYDLAKEALENWEYDNDTLDSMLSQFRISSNAIYPFYQNGEICFLRLAPIDEKLKKNILGEMEFIEYLLECGYPALTPIKTKANKVYLILDTKWGEYYATAFKGVSGVPLETTDMSNEIMFCYGKALGRLHSLSSNFKPKTMKWTHIEALDWIKSVLSEYNAPDFVVSELDDIKDELNELLISPNCYGLVYYDFEPDNVFYDEKNRNCSVIDFDDGMYHWYALDVEQVFNSLEDELDIETFQTAKNEFIRGYKEEHSYTNEMELTLPLMRRFVNLYSYARLARCVEGKFANEPNWLIGLREKLNKSILEKEAGMLK